MTKDELELKRNIVRVGGNLMVLLDIGLFPGKHTLGLEECKGFVKSIIEDAAKALEPQVEPPPAPAQPPASPAPAAG